MQLTFDLDSGLQYILQQFMAMPTPAGLIVAGGSGSGKTYLVRSLKKYIIEVDELNHIEQDHFYRDKDDLLLPRDDRGKASYDLPESFHQQEFKQTIAVLLSGNPCRIPYYEKIPNRRVADKSWMALPLPRLIADGLFTIEELRNVHPNILPVFIEAEREICRASRIKRDMVELEQTQAFIEKFFDERVWPFYEKFVLPQRKLAKIIIQNNRR